MPLNREGTEGKIVMAFPEGWLGENSDWPADMLLPGQLSATQDVHHLGPELARRDGHFREPDAVTSAVQIIVGGFAADFSTGQKTFVQVVSANSDTVGRFYVTSAGMTTWSALGTSAFGQPATYALLGDVLAIATNGGTLVAASGTFLGVFDIDGALGGVSAAPDARFTMSYKNRLYAAGHDVSADEVKHTAIGATTGLPAVADWYSTGNAGNRIFGQGEGNRIIGIAADKDQWYAFKRNRVLSVTGNTPATFVTSESDREWGPYHRSVAIVGRGIVGANEDGICSVVDGKVEPLLPDHIMTYWRSLNLSAISAFQGAWSGSRDEYRLTVMRGAAWEMLIGVFKPARPVAWYRWAPPGSRAIFTRLVGGNRLDFYQGGSADGYLLRMDQGSQDASANFAASFESGILDDGSPQVDKCFRAAWVIGRTRGPWNVSCTFRVHDEDGEPTPIGSNLRNLDLTSAVSGADVKRATYVLDGQYGWGISFRADFDPSSAGSIHRVIIAYDVVDRTGRGKAR
jgi:hypothetical protein